MWFGPPTTSLAVCGSQPAGSPRSVLCKPDQATNHRKLQHTCLWIYLDHRGMDRGEQTISVLSRWCSLTNVFEICTVTGVSIANSHLSCKSPSSEAAITEGAPFFYWGILLPFVLVILFSPVVLSQLWSGLPPASCLLQWGACREQQLWVWPSVCV